MSYSERYSESYKAEKASGFISTKKERGSASKEATLKRLGLKSESVSSSPKYYMIEGVPHKMVGGKWVALTKLS